MKKIRCKQCENPLLKGLHTCEKKKKKMKHRKTPSLYKRLRTPIDAKRNVISDMNSMSNIGLRMLADKLDAIGEALALLVAEKRLKEYGDGYTNGRRDGYQEHQQER